jgi:hypothetical protein|tara:strand:- start:3791 stop:3982 length:192 start_codon:yes stop_codon:yes gene_type:complete
MANSQIDVAMNAQIKDITHTAAGTVTGGVRVVIDEDANKHDAVVTLQAIIAALLSDAITLETS